MLLAKRTLTAAELAARRRNALKSTGPRTPEGKRRSSLNALKRGICPPSRELQQTLRGEDARDYRRLHRDLISLWQPRRSIIAKSVAALAGLWWKKICWYRQRSQSPEFHPDVMWVDLSIECELHFLLTALSLISDEWLPQLNRSLGCRSSSPRDLRVKIEAKLVTFQKLRRLAGLRRGSEKG